MITLPRVTRASLWRLFAVLLSLAPQVAFCDDWPNWSGPAFNGISKETGFASTWPTDGLAPEWTREIGTGFSSMSVVGNRLLAMGHADETETVWCLNAANGGNSDDSRIASLHSWERGAAVLSQS
jgi:hypothetical protein